MKPLCIYHGNCADGFGAAWAVWKLHPDWDFHPGVYQDPPPDIGDRDVVMVDFSYKLPVLKEMSIKARSMLILDHHKTAADDLAETPRAGSNWKQHLLNAAQDDMENANINGALLYTVFDMDRSGAGIAWDYFHPNRQRPPLINHIEDRDLWRFDLPGTREIQAALFSYPYDFGLWDSLIATTSTAEGLELLRNEGVAIERKHHKDVAELVDVCKRRMAIGGHEVWAASLPYTLTSDAGHLMAQGEPFAACYWDTPEGRVFSLRSTDDGLDVSEIAKLYGGGGHKAASGFRVSYDSLTESGDPLTEARQCPQSVP